MDIGDPVRMRSSHITGAIGGLLVLAGLVCNPAGYSVLNGGTHSIASPVFLFIAWGTGGVLVGSGALLFLVRRAISLTNLLLFGGVCVFSLAFMEGALAVAGLNSPYSLRLRIPDLVPWFTYDRETGSRFVPGKFVNPKWPINSDGYPGTEEFSADTCTKADPRILLLGDSFTYGVAATEYQYAYASLLEEKLCAKTNAAVWNTAIPGISQNQEIYSLQTYMPLLRPQIVTLAFCENDFNENMYPLSVHYVFEHMPYVFRYEMQPDGTVRTLSPREAFLRAHPLSERLCASRVVYQACSLARALQFWIDTWRTPNALTRASLSDGDTSPEELMDMWGARRTKRYLGEIRDYVESEDARLLVLLIPYPNDLDAPSPEYQAILHICRILGLDYLDVRRLLSMADYVTEPNYHWNNAGHAKVAEALAARVAALLGENGAVTSTQ